MFHESNTRESSKQRFSYNCANSAVLNIMQEYQIHFINCRYHKPNITMNILLSRAADTEIRIINSALLNFMYIKTDFC